MSTTETEGQRRYRTSRPEKQGLYDPAYEHDACGVGFVVDAKGRKSHKILQQGLQILENLDHRGACGAETNTGDGAGVLLQMPHKFLAAVTKKLGFQLPEPGAYGCGIVFLPRNPTLRRRIEEKFEQIVQSEGQTVLGWRTVPTNNSMLGETAKSCEPFMRQVCNDGRRRRVVVRRELVEQDDRLQRHAAHAAARAVLLGLERSAHGNGACARALTLQHEHVPELGPRPPVPLRRP
jgi:glutamate synthase domain-containing protein 1